METNKEIRKEIGKALRGRGNRGYRVFACLRKYFRSFGEKHFEYFQNNKNYFMLLVSEKDLKEMFLYDIVFERMKFKRTGDEILVGFKVYLNKLEDGSVTNAELYVGAEKCEEPGVEYRLYLSQKAPEIGADATARAVQKLFELIEEEINEGKAKRAFEERFERFMKSKIYIDGVVYIKL